MGYGRGDADGKGRTLAVRRRRDKGEERKQRMGCRNVRNHSSARAVFLYNKARCSGPRMGKGKLFMKRIRVDLWRFHRLIDWYLISRILLARAVLRLKFLYRIRFGLINVPFMLVCVFCALFAAACAQSGDSADDHAEHHHHHHHGGSYGSEQNGGFDRSEPWQSGTPIPGY
jgi:hypothetical protein